MIANLAESRSEDHLRLSFNQSRSIAKAVLDFHSVRDKKVHIHDKDKAEVALELFHIPDHEFRHLLKRMDVYFFTPD